MLIEVINVSPPETVPTANGSYKRLDVAYKTAEGKVAGKKLVSYKYPQVFESLVAATRGLKFDVTPVKDGKYWNWENITPFTGEFPVVEPASASGQGTGSTFKPTGRVAGSNYETSVEREWNRCRIIRQSSINAAIALQEVFGSKRADVRTVLEMAAEFEKWVHREPGYDLSSATVADKRSEAIKALGDMPDDIPY